MTNVNKKYLEKDLTSLIWRKFIKELKNAETKDDLDKIFSKLLSPKERIMLEKRLAILFLSEKRLNHREIGRILDVSTTTVGFIKNGFSTPKKKNTKKNWKNPEFERINIKKSGSKFPALVGKGRWRFLNS